MERSISLSLFSGIEYAVELLVLQHTVDALVKARFGYRAVFHGGNDGVKRLGQHLRHKDDINARLDRGDCRVAGRIGVGHTVHRHGVGDHQPRKAQLAAEVSGDHRSGKA